MNTKLAAMVNFLRASCVALCLFVALCPSNVRGQARQADTAAMAALLSISGEVERPLKLTAADLAKLPRRIVRAKAHDGKETVFEGVLLGEVLRLAGVKFGEGLRGKNLALYLVVEAADNYRAVFALPELDPAFTERIVLLADRRDDKPLSAAEGALRVVVPDEKRQARWVRQVTSLVIRRAP
ncbi:MAG: molybdopterin-dependent oxidoreductase [Pyrinomonadaceae bacterium]|nr:molybdopterin-dependent oxidoreductase [Pyrinomonadaceae bacterium]